MAQQVQAAVTAKPQLYLQDPRGSSAHIPAPYTKRINIFRKRKMLGQGHSPVGEYCASVVEALGSSSKTTHTHTENIIVTPSILSIYFWILEIMSYVCQAGLYHS